MLIKQKRPTEMAILMNIPPLQIYFCYLGVTTHLFVLFVVVLHPSKTTVISGWVSTCHSWQLYSAATLEHQAASTMTC